VYQRGDSFSDGKTRSFTIRTTEKEKELVQVMLDRLLRDEKDESKTLLAKTTIKTPIDATTVKGSVVTLELDTPALPSYLKSFIERELKLNFYFPEVGGTDAVIVTGVVSGDNAAEENRTQRFKTMTIDFTKNTKFSLGKPDAKPEAVKDDINAIIKILNNAKASFESRPLPERLETFDPALAADTKTKAFWAIALSWAAVLAYLWFRFGSWQFGLAAVLCLIHDLCFTLGCIAACHYLHDNFIGSALLLQDFKIDLTAVAALLTLVGYSVNDTIVVFDRIREVRGKSPALTYQMINDSVNQTLSRTVLASLTVFLVVGVLYVFGGEGVHLFAFVMVIGVIVGTYSSIYIASPLLLLFGEGKAHTHASALVAGDKPSEEVATVSSTSASAPAD
jgi:SecD/SecF fusion protein